MDSYWVTFLIHPLPYKTSRSLRSSGAGLLFSHYWNKQSEALDCIFNTFVLIFQLQEIINDLKCLNPFFVFVFPSSTSAGFRRKEFRGKLAIAITANFVNRNTTAEAKVEEISGVAFIFNQKFFLELKEDTGESGKNVAVGKWQLLPL